MADKPLAQIEVRGAKQLRREFKKVGGDMSEFTLMHREIAAKVVAKAKPRIPEKTGALRKTMKGKGTQSRASIKWGKDKLPYAAIVEFGGYPKGRPFIKAGRHVFPAIRRMHPQIINDYREHTDRIVDKFNALRLTQPD